MFDPDQSDCPFHTFSKNNFDNHQTEVSAYVKNFRSNGFV